MCLPLALKSLLLSDANDELIESISTSQLGVHITLILAFQVLRTLFFFTRAFGVALATCKHKVPYCLETAFRSYRYTYC